MFSQRIRQLRQERGLTQTEVAEEVHLSMRGYRGFLRRVSGLADGPHPAPGGLEGMRKEGPP